MQGDRLRVVATTGLTPGGPKEHVYRRGTQMEGFLWCEQCQAFFLTEEQGRPQFRRITDIQQRLREHPHRQESGHPLRYTTRLTEVWVYWQGP
jgi:hypothetical protein